MGDLYFAHGNHIKLAPTGAAPSNDTGEVIARGEPMEPAESWRARQKSQRTEYEVLKKEHTQSGGPELDKCRMVALLLHGLSVGGSDPVDDVLSSILIDLKAMHALVEDRGPDPMTDKIFMIARQIEMVQVLYCRSTRGTR